jgi:flagellar P-ring protein precursor FlgI
MFSFNRCNGPHKGYIALGLAVLLALSLGVFPERALAQPVLLKDLAHVQGVTANQLVGYGVVTGLAGTGDSTSVTFTSKTIQNILQNFGVSTNLSDVQTRNVASVTVTAELPPFAHSGDRIDVTVSSMGDASTLQGGTLILSELRAPDNQVYATAQGPISVGGFTVGQTGNSVTRNHTAAGRIPQGGVIARNMKTDLQTDSQGFSYVLTSPNAQTAARVARALNHRFGPGVARANDYETIHVRLPYGYTNDPVDFLADAGDISILTGETARVVMNERTGTVVMGGDITLAPVAIAHGNLSVTITTRNTVVPPGPFTRAQSRVETNTTVRAGEGAEKKLILLRGSPTLAQVVRSLNTIGVSPRDLIAIVQALREAGSLQADLEII